MDTILSTSSNAVSDVVMGLGYKRKPRDSESSREYLKANYFAISSSCTIVHTFQNHK